MLASDLYTVTEETGDSDRLLISLSEKALSLYSGRQLTLVYGARFLISAPKVLFVEKPFIETDLQMRETTRKMLNLLTQRGITIILLFSSISSLRLMSGDEIYIQNGRIISEDELYQIFYGS